MCNKSFNFLGKKELLFSLQFGFQEKYSTTHALIHLADKIRNETDRSDYACEIFVDFLKAFNTIDHHISLKSLEHYGIRGNPNKGIAFYHNNRKQFVSINRFNFTPVQIKGGGTSRLYCTTLQMIPTF